MGREGIVAFWLGAHTTPPMVPRYMTVVECARFINRSPNAVRHLVKQAAIPCIRVGRRVQFDQRVIEGWMLRNVDRRKPR